MVPGIVVISPKGYDVEKVVPVLDLEHSSMHTAATGTSLNFGTSASQKLA